MRNKFLLTISILLALSAIWPASAQDFGFDSQNFFIELRPTDAPGVNQYVTAFLSGFGFDFNRSRITWTHNGKVVSRGTGVKEYSFTTGAIGSRETLSVSAVDSDGLPHEVALSFVIAEVDMLWKANTSVPFWYKGKALASSRSNVTVSAFPNLVSGGRKISAPNLVFNWTLDEDFKQSQSGAGKNTFKFLAGLGSEITHRVELEVSNLENSIVAKKTLDITTENPSVLIYEYDALSGPKTAFAFWGGRNGSIFAGDEKSFIAEPFFFSRQNGGQEKLEYLWIVNGQGADPGEPFNILRLKTTSDALDQSTIGVLVKNASNILQEVRQSFQIDVF